MRAFDGTDSLAGDSTSCGTEDEDEEEAEDDGAGVGVYAGADAKGGRAVADAGACHLLLGRSFLVADAEVDGQSSAYADGCVDGAPRAKPARGQRPRHESAARARWKVRADGRWTCALARRDRDVAAGVGGGGGAARPPPIRFHVRRRATQRRTWAVSKGAQTSLSTGWRGQATPPYRCATVFEAQAEEEAGADPKPFRFAAGGGGCHGWGRKSRMRRRMRGRLRARLKRRML